MAGSKVHRRGPTSPEMNVTPLIDVTFQLIIFFMLVNNIISQDVPQLIVPNLDNPKVEPPPENVMQLIVNVVPAEGEGDREREPGYLNTSGMASHVQIGGRNYAFENLEQVTEVVRAEKDRQEARNKQIEIVLRADAALHYDQVSTVMQAIYKADLEKVSLVAFQETQDFN